MKKKIGVRSLRSAKQKKPERLIRGWVYRSSKNPNYLYRITGGDRLNIKLEARRHGRPDWERCSSITRKRAHEILYRAAPSSQPDTK